MSRTFYGTYYGQVTSKKNSKVPYQNPRTGRLGVRMKNAARAQERDMVNDFRSEYLEQELPPDYFAGKVLDITISVWNKDRRRHDLDNQLTSVLDALVKAGVIPDDNQFVVGSVSAVYGGVDSVDPKTDVVIRDINNSKLKQRNF